MICSGENPFFAIYSPFCEIISGIVQGGHVTLTKMVVCAILLAIRVLDMAKGAFSAEGQAQSIIHAYVVQPDLTLKSIY